MRGGAKRRRASKICIPEDDEEEDTNEIQPPKTVLKNKNESKDTEDFRFPFDDLTSGLSTPRSHQQSNRCQSHRDDFADVYNKERPISMADLAIHKKKIEEVKNWLEAFVVKHSISSNESTKRHILVLSGPTGSGKSTLAHQLCRSLQIRIIEHGDHLEKASESMNVTKFKYAPLKLVRTSEEEIGKGSPITHSQPSILLIDDYMTFGSCQRLLESLLFNENIDYRNDLSKYDSMAILLVITDPIDNQSTIWNDHLVTRLLRMPTVTHIQTNPVAATLIKRVVPKAPPQMVLQGDLRSAFINGKFYEIDAADIQSNTASDASVDVRIDLFHALGKILYPRKDSLENRLIDLGELWTDERSLFLAYLQENYLHERLCLGDVVGISEVISVVDAFLSDSPATATLPDRYISHLMSSRAQDTRSTRSFASFRKPRSFDERFRSNYNRFYD